MLKSKVSLQKILRKHIAEYYEPRFAPIHYVTITVMAKLT